MIGRLDKMQKERSFEHSLSKETNSNLSVGQDKRKYKVDLKHLAVVRNSVCGQHSICSMWFFSDR